MKSEIQISEIQSAVCAARSGTGVSPVCFRIESSLISEVRMARWSAAFTPLQHTKDPMLTGISWASLSRTVKRRERRAPGNHWCKPNCFRQKLTGETPVPLHWQRLI